MTRYTLNVLGLGLPFLAACGGSGLEPGTYDVTSTIVSDTCGLGAAGTSGEVVWIVDEIGDDLRIRETQTGITLVGDGEVFESSSSDVLQDGCGVLVESRLELSYDGGVFDGEGTDELSSPDCGNIYADCVLEYRFAGTRR